MIVDLSECAYDKPPRTRRNNRGYVFETPSGFEVEVNHVTPTKWEIDGVLYRSKKSALTIFYKAWNDALSALETEFNRMDEESQVGYDAWHEAYYNAEIQAFYPEVAYVFTHFVRGLNDGDLDYEIVEN